MYFGGQKHFSFKNQSKFLTAIFGKLTKNIENDTRNRVLETKNFFEKSRKTYFDHHFIYGVEKEKNIPYIYSGGQNKISLKIKENFLTIILKKGGKNI
ncbi:MAG: hypothetical protein N2Z20_01140 [Elusimicrobiales bacterium]|nr:hypothetical protein [Elusimicrobiales bacterium]